MSEMISKQISPEPSAPPIDTQKTSNIGIGCFCMMSCYTLFLFLRSIFPVYGQIRALWIISNWKTYVNEEDEETAYFELICASYGIYGVWLSLSCVRNIYWKLWDISLDLIFQLTNVEKEKYKNQNNLFSYLYLAGNLDWQWRYCNSKGEPKNETIYKNFNMCKKMFGYFGISVLSLGIFTLPLMWCEMRCFGNKFVLQHDSYFKYILGHIYKLLTCNIVHMLWFIVISWKSEYIIDRVISHSGYFMWFPLYVIYNYFWYAYQFRYKYKIETHQFNRKNNEENVFAETITQNKYQSIENDIEHKSDSTPVAYAVEIRENENNNDNKYVCPSSFVVFVGSFMFVIGTGGLAIFWFLTEALEFTDREWRLIADTCGLYILYKLWLSPYKWLRKNRYCCNNIISKVFLEIGLFFITCGISYLNDIIRNLQCVPFGKRYTIGAIQTLIFAPFIFKMHKNIIIRWTSKLILMGYNFIVYYLIVRKVKNYHITLPIFVTINYATYCFYKFFSTNKLILKLFVDIKHSMTELFLIAKWYLYRSKVNTANLYKTGRNNIKILYANAKNNWRTWKANSYNVSHNFVEGDPRFKVPKITVPRLLELTVLKNYETYYEHYMEKKQTKMPIKNTIWLLQSAIHRVIKLHNDLINNCTIHETSLWESRYHDINGCAPVILIPNLSRDEVFQIVNGIEKTIENTNLTPPFTRQDEINMYCQYKVKILSECNILKRKIYQLITINKQTTTSEKTEKIANVLRTLKVMKQQFPTDNV